MHRTLFYALTILGAVLMARTAVAEENEAEKLFRGMEEKVRTAKTLQFHIDLRVTDALGKEWKVKGELILGEGDKYRMELDGKMFGEPVKGTEVSDGAKRKGVGDAKPSANDKGTDSPKGIGQYYRAALPREGFLLSSLNLERRGDRPPDLFKPSGFQLAGKEKVGERNTLVIQYKVAVKDGGEGLSMKMWLDAETNLPMQLTVSGGQSDIKDVMETYSAFTIDGDVDAKFFELPK